MAAHLLILAGTTEATALAKAVADRGIAGTVSFAGRVERPMRQPLPQRVGGFGGADGLAQYIEQAGVTHLIDATHPFAAQMSRNAHTAAAMTGIAHVALTRPPWMAGPDDNWQRVPDIQGAVTALDQPRRRVMLAIGRMHLAAFAARPQHHYLLRLVDPPTAPLPLPDIHVILDRGPFDETGDRGLMMGQGIELVVSKNSGGTGAYAKIAAARSLGLPVIMIDRPALPDVIAFHSVEEVLDWVGHTGTALGV